MVRRPRSAWARRRTLLAAWARRRGLTRITRPRAAAGPRPPRPAAWLRRGVLAAALLAIALVPYPLAGSASVAPGGACRGPCRHAGPGGTVLWARPLPGEWTVTAGLAGTVPAHGQAYAAVGGGLAVVGSGMTVRAYGSRTGRLLWNAELTGFPADAAIVSVRAWTGVVTAGVSYRPGGASRAEVILASGTGRQIRWYPAAPFGGAAAATAQTTAVVGTTAVTAYDNRTGAVRWRRPTGPALQAWQVAGADLYVTEASAGYLGSAPVTALRRIDLANGLESIVRPAAASFPGSLGGVAGNVVLFSAASGVTAYDGLTGLKLWSIDGAVPEGTDPAQDRFYLTEGTALAGVDPLDGHVTARASGSAVAGSAGMFAVRDGVALGLDQGPDGEAWGYDVRLQRVVWTTPGLPWPHYFVDIGGIGGSAEPGGGTVVIADCARLAPPARPTPSGPGGPGPDSTAPGGGSTATAGGAPAASASASAAPSPSGQFCQQPELVAISRLRPAPRAGAARDGHSAPGVESAAVGTAGCC